MKFGHFLKVGFCVVSVLFALQASAQAGKYIEDSAITAEIKGKIAKDETGAFFHTSVKTENGIVTLSGTVDSDTQASKLIEIAQSASGASDVVASDLKVKESSKPFEDTMITAKIKGLFIQEKLFGDKDVTAMGVSVETNNGVVSLSGTVDDKNQAVNAVSIAEKVKSVKSVKSTLTIKQ